MHPCQVAAFCPFAFLDLSRLSTTLYRFQKPCFANNVDQFSKKSKDLAFWKKSRFSCSCERKNVVNPYNFRSTRLLTDVFEWVNNGMVFWTTEMMGEPNEKRA
jgi:hypothetical protein